MRAVRAGGPEYLRLVTELLQRQRVADAATGLWEAADLQWWYTRDPHPSDEDAVFWVDGSGVPVVAAVVTRWSPGRYGCDVLGDSSQGAAWAYVRERCAGLGQVSVEMGVAPGDAVAAREAERAGFAEARESYEIDWLSAPDRPRRRELPDGYTLLARPEQTGPHPMIGRNGDEVEARLQLCSLYDPALDLAVTAPDGRVAAYALFWADRRTGVGLVEPMRVEDGHSGRGVAGGLLSAGLDRLVQRGCRSVKVSHDRDNEPAQRLYHGAGFQARTEVPVLVRPAAQ